MTAGRRDQLTTADPYCHWHHPDPCESWGCDLAAVLRASASGTDQPLGDETTPAGTSTARERDEFRHERNQEDA